MTSEHHGIVHFEIPATDPDKLSRFYTQLFGWKIEKMDMGGTPYHAVSTVPTDSQGMPSVAGAINGGIAPRTLLMSGVTNYVQVESVDQYAEKAKGLGAKVATTKMPVPGMGYFAILTDPEGNPFGVWQNDTSAHM
jgi:predicted enzyme related to lactoylglutathione lyase